VGGELFFGRSSRRTLRFVVFWRLTAGQDNGGSVKDISTIQGSIAQHLGVGVEQPSRVVEFLGNFQGGPLFI
jgi:hypothetical protein